MTTNNLLFAACRSGWQGLTQLFYPDLCVACGYELPTPDACFCMPCRLKLEPTHMHRQAENAFMDRFWGRLPLQSATALYFFTRNSPVQKALHALKYKNRPEIGFRLGMELGEKLSRAPHVAPIDVLVPVPLHPDKERSRGYNQSLWFAKGLGVAFPNALLSENTLLRLHNAGSQTRRRRMERYQNVSASFALREGRAVAGKHVLLVDDVMTTGATLETCGQLLLDAHAASLSLATIAFAVNR
jgi:ComF family protein